MLDLNGNNIWKFITETSTIIIITKKNIQKNFIVHFNMWTFFASDQQKSSLRFFFINDLLLFEVDIAEAVACCSWMASFLSQIYTQNNKNFLVFSSISLADWMISKATLYLKRGKLAQKNLDCDILLIYIRFDIEKNQEREEKL